MSVKFRPYLSLSDIEYILEKLRDDITSEAISIRKNLSMIVLKHNAGVISGSYISKPRKTISDNLGFSSQEVEKAERERKYLAGEMTEEEETSYLAELMG